MVKSKSKSVAKSTRREGENSMSRAEKGVTNRGTRSTIEETGPSSKDHSELEREMFEAVSAERECNRQTGGDNNLTMDGKMGSEHETVKFEGRKSTRAGGETELEEGRAMLVPENAAHVTPSGTFHSVMQAEFQPSEAAMDRDARLAYSKDTARYSQSSTSTTDRDGFNLFPNEETKFWRGAYQPKTDDNPPWRRDRHVREPAEEMREMMKRLMETMEHGFNSIRDCVVRGRLLEEIDRYEADHPPRVMATGAVQTVPSASKPVSSRVVEKSRRVAKGSVASQVSRSDPGDDPDSSSTNSSDESESCDSGARRQKDSGSESDNAKKTKRSKKKKKKKRHQRLVEESSSSSSENSSDETGSERIRRSRDSATQKGIKIPPFTGKESWKVYFNRFEDIARRQEWTDEEKLDVLLPRLQGEAGEFVYGQLSKKVRKDFKALAKELRHRFRKVETSKSYAAQFSRRDQKPSETVEEYAAELKRLYDKAHSGRDRKTRREDLMRRFLDGLLDEKARFHVEYIKEPKNIDGAVFEVVNYQTHKDGRQKKSARAVKATHHSDGETESHSSSDNEAERAARAPMQNYKNGFNKRPRSKPQDVLAVEEVTNFKKEIIDRISKLEDAGKRGVVFGENGNTSGTSTNNATANGACFKCGISGHYARECMATTGTEVDDKNTQKSSN